jgi:hypothetical protein
MPKITNRVFATIFASQFRFIEKTRFLLPPRSNQKPGFCHNLCFPVSIYQKNPVSHSNAHKSETGFLPQSLLPSFDRSETGFLSQSLLPSFDLSKKPGFSQQRAQIRNRVFATIFASQF